MKQFLCSWNFFKHFILSLLIVILVMCAAAAVSGPVATEVVPGPIRSEGGFTYTSAVIYLNKGIPDYVLLILFLIFLALYRPVKKFFKRIFQENG